MATKKQSQSSHFRRRFYERVGRPISKQERRAIIRQIMDGKAEFLHRASVRVSAWKVLVDGVACKVFYDRNRKNLITIWQI